MKGNEEMLGTFGRLIAFIASLSVKGLLALSSSISAIFGVIIGEWSTGQWGAAGLAGVIASGLGATFVVVPKIMEQRRLGIQTFAQLREQEISQIIKRRDDIHEKELAFYKLRESEAHYVASLERQAKHVVLSELTAAQSHNQILFNQLRESAIEPLVILHPIDWSELIGPVDKEIQDIRKKSVETARDAIPAKTATYEN